VNTSDFALAQHDERLAQRQIRASGLVEKAVEAFANAGELEPREHGVERIVRHRRR